jgi:RNA 2',3'-cyclic 3'-phosphodiesterase
MRVFAALPLPREALHALAPVTAALYARLPGLRPVRAGGLHVTLHFFGEVDEGGVRRLAGLWHDPGLRGPALAVSFGSLGRFPERGSPRVIWIGIGRGASAVCDFQRALELRIADLGFREDPKGFSPHVTLARAGTPAPPPDALDGFSAPRLDFVFGECVLFQSILGPRGPTYVPLEAITFDRGER